ncbi:hypothetical protein MtrunA17_Chr7g0238411 [Medicago truncatula]|uniref:Transmembrane protein n=1 Tax=Medicago truncatula TaxID=3880 RepID=A0A396GY78_MEDTR|nr:hypothetical protein MtrunA17_Chr7g0238411 [Medicago truncatula]
MALLQPAPKTFELFDDLVLLSEGHVIYEGPSWILRVPYSVIEAVIWAAVVYYSVDLPLQRVVRQIALGLFGMMASIARDMVLANTFGSAALLIIFLLGGYIVTPYLWTRCDYS